MIKEYFRPKTVEETLGLLEKPGSIIISGGTFVNSAIHDDITVVDIQDLDFRYIKKGKDQLIIGSCSTLQDLANNKDIPNAMKQAILHDAPINIRNMATIGGSIVVSSGQPSLSTVLLSMDAVVQFTPDIGDITYSEFLTDDSLREGRKLISSIRLQLSKTIFKSISATPESRPIVTVSLSTKQNGKTRLALGGFGKQPLLVFDGLIDDDIVPAAKSAYSGAGDELASSDYRSEMAAVLAKRCVVEMRSTFQKNSQKGG
jgi:CO/xanthine dehydrogenase FAD-binding subunit